MPQKLEDYEVLGVVGSGSFGTCYKVCHKLTKQIYVWKAIDYGKLTEDKKQLLVSEVNLLSKLNHPNIVQYFDRILHRETTTLYIITEWCQGGDLAALIKGKRRETKLFDEPFIWKALYQISKALQVCHTRLNQMTLLHRDIKPANIFIDGKGNFKLGDFGLAQSEEECCYSENIVGTPYYMSPEIIKGRKYDRKSDIWALGCLVYEICSLSPPFVGSSLHELLANIKVGVYPPIPEIYSKNLSTIISFMLSVKKEYRPTVEMILHHPLVVVNIRGDNYSKKLCRPVSETFPLKKASEEPLSEVMRDLKNISISQRNPEEITEGLFKDRWLSRLEMLREKENKLREREESIALKEHSLNNKEKYLALLERRTREKMNLAQVYLHRRKAKWTGSEENLSEISADAGDTSILPTTTKLNPNLLPKPNFLRATTSRKTISTKHVHFGPRPLQENSMNFLTGANLPSGVIWSDQGLVEFKINRRDVANKENFPLTKNSRVKSDPLPGHLPISKVYSPI